MKKIILILCSGLLLSCGSKKKTLESKSEKKSEKTVDNTLNDNPIIIRKVFGAVDKSGHLIGYINKASFNRAPYKIWFDKNYESYNPDKKTIEEITKYIKDYKIKAFMGSWCGDSKREAPRFYKILEQSNFNLENLEIIALNRSKKTPKNFEKGYDIIRVPTFIFYKDGKEVGRYVEYAKETLEKDMLQIVSGKEYKHSYQK